MAKKKTTKKPANKSRQLKTTDESPRYRTLILTREDINEEDRTVNLAFSSETPVERWDGDEILDHAAESVRLDRISNNGPVLVDHDRRDHIGVVEAVSIDADRVGRATVRLGRSPRAEEIFNDIKDGIRSLVSVGYRVFRALVEERDEDGYVSAYRVVDWEPYEISFVSIPADTSVGVGRSADNANTFVIESDDAGNDNLDTSDTEHTEHSENREGNTMPVENPDSSTDTNTGETRTADPAELQRTMLARTTAVLDAGDAYKRFGGEEIAAAVLREGGDIEEFNKRMLERMGKQEPVVAGSPEIGMNDKEVRQFSFVRALNALANPQDRSAQEAAGFEFECSRAACNARGVDSRGIMVPVDVLKRDLTAGTAGDGGHTVATNLLSGSFIEMLRNRSVLMDICTVLTDLNGNIAIPRQIGGATGYWVAESGEPTESQQAFDQVTLSPETVGAYTEFSRRLLLQSSIDIEAFVRMDLIKTLALMIDFAGLWGSGTSNQPLGIANQTGVNLVPGDTDGAAPDWAAIVLMETLVAADNADVDAMRYLFNALTRGKLKTTEKAANTAKFIWGDDNTVNGYQALVTNQIPSNLTKGTGTNLSGAIYGNFADMIIGMWGGLDLTVDPYSNSKSGTVRIVALQDCDTAVRHPDSFCVAKDFITT